MLPSAFIVAGATPLPQASPPLTPFFLFFFSNHIDCGYHRTNTRDLPFGDLATICLKKLPLRSFFFCFNPPPLHRAASPRDTLRDMSREMARVGLIEEMQDDLFEGMADSDEEEEAEAEIERVMAEVLGEAGRAGVAAPKVRWRVWRLLRVLS
jgi:hypothetical protein